MITIENDFIRISVKEKGAELCSIYHKMLQKEFLWQADPMIWARHAPILFPIIGQVQNGEYSYDGQQYKLPQHGFARDSMFELVECTDEKITLKLSSSVDTLAVYPFDFELYAEFRVDKNQVLTSYQVVNKSNATMYFSLGFHPGFICPIDEELTFEDYYLEFEKEENINQLLLDGAFLSDKKINNFTNGTNRIDLSHSLFDNDAIITEGFKSSYIQIKSDKSPHFVEVGIKDFPMIGLWTKPNANAPYLCIEPWYGVADEKDSGKNFDEKKEIQKLSVNQKFSCEFYLKVN